VIFKKRFKLWWYELGNGNKCELQHHLFIYFEKSLNLDLEMDFELPNLL
jgi:hypothetical protein